MAGRNCRSVIERLTFSNECIVDERSSSVTGSKRSLERSQYLDMEGKSDPPSEADLQASEMKAEAPNCTENQLSWAAHPLQMTMPSFWDRDDSEEDRPSTPLRSMEPPPALEIDGCSQPSDDDMASDPMGPSAFHTPIGKSYATQLHCPGAPMKSRLLRRRRLSESLRRLCQPLIFDAVTAGAGVAA